MKKIVAQAAVAALVLGLAGGIQGRPGSGQGATRPDYFLPGETGVDWFFNRVDEYRSGLCNRRVFAETGAPMPKLKLPKQDKPKSSGSKGSATIEGVVLDKADKPARDVEIHVWGLDEPSHFLACSDTKGRYSAKLAAGRYVACLSYLANIGLCRDVTLLRNKKEKADFPLRIFSVTNVETLNKRLPPGSGGSGYYNPFSRVEGRVFSGDQLAPGIPVHFQKVDSPGTFTATTDARGYFSSAVPPGDYIAGIEYKGTPGLWRELTVRRGRVVQSDFDLKQFPN
ncbi:MAG TPA: carboxypeptidase-like regulatory domain-containing protein [Terriglobia bacterium]|nr:carboxypeptidase-like regulatory domain-containing protein [Terriglobia bacterium]